MKISHFDRSTRFIFKNKKTSGFRNELPCTISLETPSESKKPARTNQNKDISIVGTSSNNKENRVEEVHAKTQENKATVLTTQQVNNSRKLQVKDNKVTEKLIAFNSLEFYETA